MRIPIAITLAAAAVPLVTASPAAPAAKPLVYRVTIANTTPADLTRVVYAVHDRTVRPWRPRGRASAGLAALARDGSVDRLVAEWRARRGVRSSGVVNRIAPGGAVTFTLRTTTRHRKLSWASMLVCSNDAFAGQSGYALPLRRGTRTRFGLRLNARAWDAGAERNTESAAHVPCLGAHGVGPDERRAIRRHPGIRGHADLSRARHGWGRYAARVTIRRIR